MLPDEEGGGGGRAQGVSRRWRQRGGKQDDTFSATMAGEGGLQELVDGILFERMLTAVL